MPIYSYVCPNGHEFDARRAWGEHVLRCPECGAPVRQVYHAPVIQYRRRNWKPYHPDDAAKGETVKEEICVSE